MEKCLDGGLMSTKENFLSRVSCVFHMESIHKKCLGSPADIMTMKKCLKGRRSIARGASRRTNHDMAT